MMEYMIYVKFQSCIGEQQYCVDFVEYRYLFLQPKEESGQIQDHWLICT